MSILYDHDFSRCLCIVNVCKASSDMIPWKGYGQRMGQKVGGSRQGPSPKSHPLPRNRANNPNGFTLETTTIKKPPYSNVATMRP